VEHLKVPGLTAERCLVWMRQRTEEKLPSVTYSDALKE